MALIEIINSIMQAQTIPGGPVPIIYDCASQGAECPASAFTAIGAAFATEGYWVQSDLIYYLTHTGFGAWAPLLYICAAMGGLVSLSIGMPPKTYIWFFIGPALYAWLLDSTQAVHGVEWRVANQPQDQREVWKLAETGLKNKGAILRNGVYVSAEEPPSEPAEVALMFLWFDEVISDTVQWLTEWTGVYNLLDNPAAAGRTNISDAPPGSDSGRWYLLSNLKWTMLENITSATLNSTELRDAFATFMSSECGDLLKKSIDESRFVAAANARTQSGIAPWTVFSDYGFLTANLSGQTVPTPRSLKQLLNTNDQGAFRNFDPFFSSGFVNMWGVRERLTCDQYLSIIVAGFRWEAGHSYFQLIKSAPPGFTDGEVVYNLLYGWDVKKGMEPPDPTFVGPPAPPPNDGIMTIEEQKNYIKDLILLHIFKNEFTIAKPMVDVRYSNSARIESFSEGYQRGVGQKAKFGEVYTWALMVPYLQGILMYLLAMAYPFACVVMVIPGMHKTIFTWMSFWAWVKLWDFGFAMVIVLERSIWAMLGNNSAASKIADIIAGIQTIAVTNVSCPGASGGGLNCAIPAVENGGASLTSELWRQTVIILDKALTLGPRLDFDLQNSYYIYIMSALYFAVPTITGQLVLGARSGAASMVNSAIGGVSQEAGKQAGAGALGESITRMHANMGSARQAETAKSLRNNGLAEQAMGYGNKAMMAEMGASATQTASGNIGNAQNSLGLGMQSHQKAADVAMRGAIAGVSGFGTVLNDLAGIAAGNGVGGGGPGGGPRSNWRRATDVADRNGRPIAELGHAMALNNVGQQGLATQMGMDQTKAGMAIQGFQQSQMGRGYGEAGRRAGSEANFAAEQDTWDAMNKYSAHLAGASAALGGFAGQFNPGHKPNNMEGMAMDGMLNSSRADTRATARMPLDNWGSIVGGATKGLNDQYGSSFVASYGRNWTAPESFKTGFGTAEIRYPSPTPQGAAKSSQMPPIR